MARCSYILVLCKLSSTLFKMMTGEMVSLGVITKDKKTQVLISALF